MTLHKAAEVVSLVLTSPTIVYGIMVVVYWWPEAWRAIRVRPAHRSHTDWLIIGVAAGFLGSIADNAYWGIAWTADFLAWESRDALFSGGVYSNIPFRQLAGLFSAYCHVRSYQKITKTTRYSAVCGSIALIALWFVVVQTL